MNLTNAPFWQAIKGIHQNAHTSPFDDATRCGHFGQHIQQQANETWTAQPGSSTRRGTAPDEVHAPLTTRLSLTTAAAAAGPVAPRLKEAEGRPSHPPPPVWSLDRQPATEENR